ncbi:MAG TPA: PEP-CTERM sorting domain-containing protein [Gemmatimonadaceae bacterium]|nr:PEP-CTERM sorting domain-containing protein [Gemmatimonadaceae bacterium]
MAHEPRRGPSYGLVLVLLAPVALHAQVLDFEGLRHRELVQGYYDGGVGSLGSGPGPDLGIVFSDNALVGSEPEPESNWANTPSGTNVLLFLTGRGAVMNVPGGFSTGFSFWYSSSVFEGAVSVYSGPNTTGTLLATLELSALGSCGPPDPYCHWAPIGVSFEGTAMSVDFGGTANQIGFDNVTLESAIPGGSVVPEPVSAALLATGLAGLGAAARRRRRKTAA